MAYINAEQVKAIRQTLKETFPKDRFGCRKQDYSSVHITVKKSGLDWSNLFTDLEVSMANEKYMLSLANIEAYRPKLTESFVNGWLKILTSGRNTGGTKIALISFSLPNKSNISAN